MISIGLKQIYQSFCQLLYVWFSYHCDVTAGNALHRHRSKLLPTCDQLLLLDRQFRSRQIFGSLGFRVVDIGERTTFLEGVAKHLVKPTALDPFQEGDHPRFC